MAAEEGRDLLLRRFTAKSCNYICDLFADALGKKECWNDDAEDDEKKCCRGAEIGGRDLSCKPPEGVSGDDRDYHGSDQGREEWFEDECNGDENAKRDEEKSDLFPQIRFAA
jgi:hypothetical protein